jgi:hypothetical protein
VLVCADVVKREKDITKLMGDLNIQLGNLCQVGVAWCCLCVVWVLCAWAPELADGISGIWLAQVSMFCSSLPFPLSLLLELVPKAV